MSFISLCWLVAGSLVPSQDAHSTLTISISGTEHANGQLILTLFTTEDTFLKEPFITKEYPISNSLHTTIILEAVPHGTYAFNVIHDENKNGELDVNMFGIPKEPYGFSNHARGKFGPPAFENAKVHVNSASKKFEITVK